MVENGVISEAGVPDGGLDLLFRSEDGMGDVATLVNIRFSGPWFVYAGTSSLMKPNLA